MRMDKLTTKFQLALADAQSLAVGRDHQFIEPLHVMTALLDQVKTDDDARQKYVDLLELMGPTDPRTVEYRRQLTARLY